MKNNIKTYVTAAVAMLAASSLTSGEFIDLSAKPSVPKLNPVWICFEQPDLRLLNMENLKTVPNMIGSVKPQKVTFTDGIYRFKRKKYVITDYSLFFNEFETEKDGVLVLGFGADWFMKVWLDGKVLVDTLKKGNCEADISPANYTVKVPAAKGKHLLAAEVHSGSGGYVFAAGHNFRTSPAFHLFADIAKTDWRKIDRPRQKCMDVIEHAVLHDISSTVFSTFDQNPYAGELKRYYEPFPILAIYDAAIDKVMDEIPQTTVPEGTVVLWHLYNMGYVIKTHSHCFGIDLHHRRAHLLEPYLDFLLTTHNHEDHYNMNLLGAMAAAGKKVYTSFYPASGYMRDPKTIKIDDITITTGKTDHNANLPGFITTYLIRIGEGKDACVIYQTGDSCNHEQLNPGEHVNIWIPHPRVGLNVVKGAEKIKPDWIFYSHFLEMGHCHPCRWRPVNFREVQENDIPGCAKFGVKGAIPLWGEKIVWTAGMK